VSAKIKGKAKANSTAPSNADSSKSSRNKRGGESKKAREGRDNVKREVDGHEVLHLETSEHSQDDILE